VSWTEFQSWVTNPYVQSAMVVALGYLGGIIADWFGVRVVARMTAKTVTEYDDMIVEACRPAVRTSVLLSALYLAVELNDPLPQIEFVLQGLISSWAIIIWTKTIFSVSGLVTQWFAEIDGRFSAVTTRTQPAWEMAIRLFVAAIAAYFFFLCWEFDVTGWLASAGIIGVAVGFGAKDTMANLFAGVGILADNTYRLGDFLLLNTGERGRVTDIGLRSTRLLTQDELEIIVPNSVMATAKIINESGGPNECERIHIDVNVAYGSDVDQVKGVLLDVAKHADGVMHGDTDRAPAVRFTSMGEYALTFQLLVFIERPELKPDVIDRLNTGSYRALGDAGINIPFPQRQIHLTQTEG